MENTKTVRCQIHCQKGETVDVHLNMNEGVLEQENLRLAMTETAENGCRMGQIQLAFNNEVHTSHTHCLQMEDPVQIELPMEESPLRMTAMYMYNEWWTRPAFLHSFAEIPERTQVLFLEYPDRFACLVPMVGNDFKTCLAAGGENTIRLVMNAGIGGQSCLLEPLYLLAEAPTLREAAEKVFVTLARRSGIRLRQERRLPEMFRYLGWCSWDAFYSEVTEEKVRQKATELVQKHVPVRWLLVDDGWLSISDKRLSDFAPDKVKFPNGFRTMTQDIKASTMVDWIGVWHALGGYWCGIAPKSVLADRADTVTTMNGAVVPSPENGERFYSDWYDLLQREGIDFVKVDGQSAAAYYFENTLSTGQAARGIHKALENGSSRMDGAVINCMGMAMESILSRKTSALSRNSDDFVPSKEGGFAEHLLQNAYNSLYHNMFYYCDWDMFWTKHPDSVKHSLLRAVSGGPVYFSDRIGETDLAVLKPLCYLDGSLLMMERSAMPTDDCIFSDPTKSGVLKLHNVAHWGSGKTGGGIAVYNLTGVQQAFSFAPADIPELTVADRYWVLDYFGKSARLVERNQQCEGVMDADGFGWYVILPQLYSGTCLGRLDKYAGFIAAQSILETDHATVAVIQEAGTLGWMAEKAPQRVLVDGEDVTEQVRSQDCLYSISLPEKPQQAVLTILW